MYIYMEHLVYRARYNVIVKKKKKKKKILYV